MKSLTKHAINPWLILVTQPTFNLISIRIFIPLGHQQLLQTNSPDSTIQQGSPLKKDIQIWFHLLLSPPDVFSHPILGLELAEVAFFCSQLIQVVLKFVDTFCQFFTESWFLFWMLEAHIYFFFEIPLNKFRCFMDHLWNCVLFIHDYE